MITVIVSHFTIENENLSQKLQSVSEPGYELHSWFLKNQRGMRLLGEEVGEDGMVFPVYTADKANMKRS